MRPPPVLIKGISQKNNHMFTIEWTDGIICDYALEDLQRNCPCARCSQQKEQKYIYQEQPIVEPVKAIRISNVGRYALRIQFTSGCSLGIFSYEFLRELSK